MTKTDFENRLVAITGVAALVLSTSACGEPSSPDLGGPSPSPTPSITRIIALSGGLAFGEVNGGETKELSFVIANSGNAPLAVSGMTLPADDVSNWTSGTIGAGQSQNVTVHFTPTADQDYGGTLSITSDATSGTSTLSVSGRGRRTGRVLDPLGDARSAPNVTVPPDLLEAEVSTSGGALSVKVTFAAGTASQADVFGSLYLDIDENPATGRRGTDSVGTDGAVIGVKYIIVFVRPQGSTIAEIIRMRPDNIFSDVIGTVGVSFVNSNTDLVRDSARPSWRRRWPGRFQADRSEMGRDGAIRASGYPSRYRTPGRLDEAVSYPRHRTWPRDARDQGSRGRGYRARRWRGPAALRQGHRQPGSGLLSKRPSVRRLTTRCCQNLREH